MKYERINGHDFYNMVVNASNRLVEESDFVNALNVFPVPDGDTGTNMSMTFKAAVKEIENLNNKIATRQKKMEKLNPATLGYIQLNQEKEIFKNSLADKEIELLDGMERTLDSLCKDIPSFIDNLTEDINIETLFNRFNKLVKKYEDKTNQYTDFAENLYNSLEKMNSKYSGLVDLSSSELKV